ncbi:MAG: PAS domain S-box protein [Actinomycetota bacterium]|nr:PAS domain S-box protein [Actinomycetota bacterium]
MESEQKFRSLADAAPAAIAIYQGDELRYVNPTSERITGCSLEDQRKPGRFQLVHLDSRDMVLGREAARVFGEEEQSRYGMKMITRSGEGHWLDITSTGVICEGKPDHPGHRYRRHRAQAGRSRVSRICPRSQGEGRGTQPPDWYLPHSGEAGCHSRGDITGDGGSPARFMAVSVGSPRMHPARGPGVWYPPLRGSCWRQGSDIVVDGEGAGLVEVCYLEERPESYEGPFLKEERDIIDAVAERLGRIVERE